MPVRHASSRPIATAAANDNDAASHRLLAGPRAWLGRMEHRLLMPVALACLGIGLVFTIASALTDSVVVSHASRSAMIFGFVGLRRAAGFGPETPVDASP